MGDGWGLQEKRAPAYGEAEEHQVHVLPASSLADQW